MRLQVGSDALSCGSNEVNVREEVQGKAEAARPRGNGGGGWGEGEVNGKVVPREPLKDASTGDATQEGGRHVPPIQACCARTSSRGNVRGGAMARMQMPPGVNQPMLHTQTLKLSSARIPVGGGSSADQLKGVAHMVPIPTHQGKPAGGEEA